MSPQLTPGLDIRIDKQPNLTVAWCARKVVIETWPKLSTTFRELIPEGKPIRVDLSATAWVDSVGIGAFVSVWASAKKAGCDLKFRNPNELVQDVVELTKLYDLFERPAS